MLQSQSDVVEYQGRSLINFEKWVHLKNKSMEALHYRDIALGYTEAGHEATVTLLTSQLRGVPVTLDFDHLLMTKSGELQLQELNVKRANPLKAFGWN
jgi:hypothetical protein